MNITKICLKIKCVKSYLSFQRLLDLLRQHAPDHHLLAVNHQFHAARLASRHLDRDQNERLGGQRLPGELQHALIRRRNLRNKVVIMKYRPFSRPSRLCEFPQPNEISVVPVARS